MSEKVLFEFRAEENDDGYTFVVKHDKETFPSWGPSIIKRFLPSCKEDAMERLRKHRKLSRRRMRRTLDFYETMYGELYGPQNEGEA